MAQEDAARKPGGSQLTQKSSWITRLSGQKQVNSIDALRYLGRIEGMLPLSMCSGFGLGHHSGESTERGLFSVSAFRGSPTAHRESRPQQRRVLPDAIPHALFIILSSIGTS